MSLVPVPMTGLTNSARRYNCLVNDHEQPYVSLHDLELLAQLFLRYNAQAIFGLHLVHGHFRIPSDTVMLGSMFTGHSSGYWTKPIPYDKIHAKDVHGHIYTISAENDLLAYEYREGTAPDNIAKIDAAFFHEFTKYLGSNKLGGVLGLEVLEDRLSSQSQMLEFVLADQGTVMLKKEDATNAHIYRVTGWSFARSADGTVSIKGNETHASRPGEDHKLFTDGKLLESIDAVMSLLLKNGVIKNQWNLAL